MRRESGRRRRSCADDGIGPQARSSEVRLHPLRGCVMNEIEVDRSRGKESSGNPRVVHGGSTPYLNGSMSSLQISKRTSRFVEPEGSAAKLHLVSGELDRIKRNLSEKLLLKPNEEPAEALGGHDGPCRFQRSARLLPHLSNGQTLRGDTRGDGNRTCETQTYTLIEIQNVGFGREHHVSTRLSVSGDSRSKQSESLSP